MNPEPTLTQPVESPVICKPYYKPDRYRDYDRQINGDACYTEEPDGVAAQDFR